MYLLVSVSIMDYLLYNYMKESFVTNPVKCNQNFDRKWDPGDFVREESDGEKGRKFSERKCGGMESCNVSGERERERVSLVLWLQT